MRIRDCFTYLSYADGKIHNGSRPLKHMCTVLYENYFKIIYITRLLLKSSASNRLEIVRALRMKSNGKS